MDTKQTQTLLGKIKKIGFGSYNDYDIILSKADLSGLDLSGLDLSNSYLYNVSFEGSNLSNTNLEGSYVFGANFKDAIVNDATNLDHTNIEDALNVKFYMGKAIKADKSKFYFPNTITH